MTKTHLLLLASCALLWSGLADAQNLVLSSRLEISAWETLCPANHWCLTIRTIDLQTTKPLPGALLSAGECGTVVADSTGQARLECSEEGEVQVQVASIGYRLAGGGLRVAPGHAYTGIATLRPIQAGTFSPHPYLLPACGDQRGDESKRACLEVTLEEEQVRLAAVLDSARAVASGSATLDSAQAAWHVYVVTHCQSRGALELPASAARVAELDCRLRLTEQRVYQFLDWIQRPTR